MSFLRRSKEKCQILDLARQVPTIRVGGCTGEKEFGLTDKTNGHFVPYGIIRTEKDIAVFCKRFWFSDIDIKWEC
ncbi:MAG: hypothetical protein LKE40_03510 [Spirochaetia bacterium]|nr:hypothetical protein [Spirochaetia bacterium]